MKLGKKFNLKVAKSSERQMRKFDQKTEKKTGYIIESIRLLPSWFELKVEIWIHEIINQWDGECRRFLVQQTKWATIVTQYANYSLQHLTWKIVRNEFKSNEKLDRHFNHKLQIWICIMQSVHLPKQKQKSVTGAKRLKSSSKCRKSTIELNENCKV